MPAPIGALWQAEDRLARDGNSTEGSTGAELWRNPEEIQKNSTFPMCTSHGTMK